MKIKIKTHLLKFLIKEFSGLRIFDIKNEAGFIVEYIVLIEWVEKNQFKLLEKIVKAKNNEVQLKIDISVLAGMHNYFTKIDYAKEVDLSNIRDILQIIDPALQSKLLSNKLYLKP